MYRKCFLRGCCFLAFGLGLLVGHNVNSWFFCCCGGMVLIILGLFTMGRK